TGAQEDSPLLVHRVIAAVGLRAGANSAIESRQAAFLRVAASEIPLVAATAIDDGGYEPPRIDGRIGRVLSGIVSGEQAGLHVGHDPRAWAFTAAPDGGGAEVRGLH